MWCRVKAASPPHPVLRAPTPISATRSPPPAPIHLPLQAPHGKQDPVQTPSGTVHTASSSPPLGQQPLSLSSTFLSIHLPSLPLSQALLAKRMPSSEHPTEMKPDAELVSKNQTDSSGGQTPLVRLSAWIDLTFLPLDFLIIYSSNSSPSLLPAPCTWVSIYFLFIHFHSYKFNSYVFLW